MKDGGRTRSHWIEGEKKKKLTDKEVKKSWFFFLIKFLFLFLIKQSRWMEGKNLTLFVFVAPIRSQRNHGFSSLINLGFHTLPFD